MIPLAPLLAAAAIAGAGWYGFVRGESHGVAVTVAHWQGVVQKMLERAAEAAETARADREVLEANWRNRYDAAIRTQAAEQARAQRMARDLQLARTERDGLRTQLDAFARGPADAGDDSLAAARDRAAALGSVLDRVLQDLERRTLAAETHAADVRSLLAAWPTSFMKDE